MADGTTTTETALVTVQRENALSLFTQPAAIDPILAQIRARIDAFEADVTTATGRKAIASIAYKVAQSKTYLDGIGKELVDEQKKIPNLIDASRRRIRDTLDAWKDEVRKPLTEWETAEKDRVDNHKINLGQLQAIGTLAATDGSAQLAKMIAQVEAQVIDGTWEEFETDAHRAKSEALARLRTAKDAAEKREAEQAELARLRAEAEEREKADRERRIAEAAAEAERTRARREAEEAALTAAREIARVEAAAAAEREAAERRERQHQAELAAAKQAAEEATARAEAEAKAKADREKAERERREADAAHRASVKSAAAAAMIGYGIEEVVAEIVVGLIAEGKIPHVAINF